jgi:hypothetical protein
MSKYKGEIARDKIYGGVLGSALSKEPKIY